MQSATVSEILSTLETELHKATEKAQSKVSPLPELVKMAVALGTLKAATATMLDRREIGQRTARVAAEKRAAEMFTLTWRGGDYFTAQGWEELERVTGYAQTTLRVKISKGKGTFDTLMINPETGEQDLVTVARDSKTQPKPDDNVKPPSRLRGRPRKNSTDIDTLGTEFAQRKTRAKKTKTP